MQTTDGKNTLTQPTPQPPDHRARRRPIPLLVLIAVVGLATDQVTKALAVAHLVPGRPRQVVGTLLQLNLTRNSGAAFSIGTSATWVLTLIACAVIVATLVFARRLRSRVWAVALGLLLAGALGNLSDRFFRPPGGGRGHVVDFLELPHWPIFNVADMCVVSAACLIALLAFIGLGIDGTRAGDRHDPQPGPAQESRSGGEHPADDLCEKESHGDGTDE